MSSTNNFYNNKNVFVCDVAVKHIVASSFKCGFGPDLSPFHLQLSSFEYPPAAECFGVYRSA